MDIITFTVFDITILFSFFKTLRDFLKRLMMVNCYILLYLYLLYFVSLR